MNANFTHHAEPDSRTRNVDQYNLRLWASPAYPELFADSTQSADHPPASPATKNRLKSGSASVMFFYKEILLKTLFNIPLLSKQKN
jgi:hypothetical protein